MTPAPYPAETRAKGWRFELDYEQIEQSSTWSVAKPAARPWLLMMWMLAWKQVPCGSWPADEEVIAGALGIDEDQWALHRKALMRGWTEADDGRLYHPTITKRVLEMMAKRRSDSDRQAAKRAREATESTPTHADVTRDTAVTPTVVGCESSTDHRPPTTDTSPPSVKKRRASAPQPPSAPEGVDAGVWSDWLLLRKTKGAPVTATVVQSATEEAALAGMSLEAFLRIWCVRGSQGLQADWLKPHERPAAQTETTYTRDKKRQAAGWMGSFARGTPDPNTIDMESTDAARIPFDA